MRSRTFVHLLASLLLLVAAGPALAVCVDGEAVLMLRIDGTDIIGEVDCADGDRENASQVKAFGHGISKPGWDGSGTGSGTTTSEPITFVKPVDKTTPLILQALATNQPIEGEFRFYGDPAQPTLITLRISFLNARFLGVSNAAGQGESEPMEAVSIGYGSLTVEDVVNGVEYALDWSGVSS